MKESEYQEARLRNAAGVLHHEISRLCTGLPMSRHTVQKVAEWIEIHRTDCRRKGIDFPEMVVVAFPLIGAIEICRRDWVSTDIEIFIVGLPAKYPNISAQEIADAVRQAWPGYKPRAPLGLIAQGSGRLQ